MVPDTQTAERCESPEFQGVTCTAAKPTRSLGHRALTIQRKREADDARRRPDPCADGRGAIGTVCVVDSEPLSPSWLNLSEFLMLQSWSLLPEQ